MLWRVPTVKLEELPIPVPAGTSAIEEISRPLPILSFDIMVLRIGCSISSTEETVSVAEYFVLTLFFSKKSCEDIYMYLFILLDKTAPPYSLKNIGRSLPPPTKLTLKGVRVIIIDFGRY
jgi:hypothetical protein